MTTVGNITFGPSVSNNKGGVNVWPARVVSRPPAPDSMSRLDQAARKHVESANYTPDGRLLYDELPPVTVGAGTAANDNGRVVIGGFPGVPLQELTRSGWKLIAHSIDTLPRHGFIYLASPYSLYKHGFHMAARHASRAAAALMNKGLVVYCPIAHGHAIACDNDLPTTWEFWKGQCQPFIDAASACVVLKLDGWKESVGVSYEVEEFERQGKPVVYVTMDELGAFCGATVREEWKMRRAA